MSASIIFLLGLFSFKFIDLLIIILHMNMFAALIN